LCSLSKLFMRPRTLSAKSRHLLPQLPYLRLLVLVLHHHLDSEATFPRKKVSHPPVAGLCEGATRPNLLFVTALSLMRAFATCPLRTSSPLELAVIYHTSFFAGEAHGRCSDTHVQHFTSTPQPCGERSAIMRQQICLHVGLVFPPLDLSCFNFFCRHAVIKEK